MFDIANDYEGLVEMLQGANMHSQAVQHPRATVKVQTCSDLLLQQ